MNYTELVSYVADSLYDYKNEADIALDYMDKYRCPLTTASETIVDVIDDAIRDWCDDNDIDYYNFDSYNAFEKDIEDIFFDALNELDSDN